MMVFIVRLTYLSYRSENYYKQVLEFETEKVQFIFLSIIYLCINSISYFLNCSYHVLEKKKCLLNLLLSLMAQFQKRILKVFRLGILLQYHHHYIILASQLQDLTNHGR